MASTPDSTASATTTATPWSAGSLLEVRDLVVEFKTRDGIAHVINGASFSMNEGETLALLGESGSGKSVTALAIMGLLDTPPAFVRSGSIRYRGRDVFSMSIEERRALRAKDIAMVFQDALSALNPVFPVGWQIAEPLRLRSGLSMAEAERQAIALMERVRIPAARARVHDYPHQFSGGMRQRVMIAMALALGPRVLIADEPTTALDVTVQAQIMDLLAELQRETRMALLLITHDLGVVAEVADRIAIMYAGRVVEHADAISLYAAPGHPYTKALLDSIPRIDSENDVLESIKGLPPNLIRIPNGCPFHPRCPRAEDLCRTMVPADVDLGAGRTSACHFAAEVRDSGR
jgi:peptide/nickel transport system ATP-binding protein